MPELKSPSSNRSLLKQLTSASHLKKAKAISKLPPQSQLKALLKCIELLAQTSDSSKSRANLVGQPFDSHLLALSTLYRRSRNLYLTIGGAFTPSLLSSGRTLSSDSLITNHIEYSPIEQELIWIATDILEKKNPTQLISLRSYCNSVFHEQNHRILWSLLPPPPTQASHLRMYLNFAESLVVATDMALGDELGPHQANLFYQVGVIYHPGTLARKELGNVRNYRNYLHAAIYATYLNLELFNPDEIQQATHFLYPNLGQYEDDVLDRSLRLDRKFVEKTNPFWQHRHSKKVKNISNINQIPNKTTPPLELPKDPLDNRLLYLWAEKWMDKMGI